MGNVLQTNEVLGTQLSLQPDNRSTQLFVQVVPGTAAPLAPATVQGTILIDPQNTTGVATPTGAAVATVTGVFGSFTGPVFTSGQALLATWATLSPYFTVDTTLVQVSGDVDGTTPWAFFPVLGVNPSSGLGVTINITGIPSFIHQAVAAGPITAKNTATNTELLCTNFGGDTTLPPGTFVQNLTHPSFAWILKRFAGQYRMTQPMPLTAMPSGGSGIVFSPPEVNTWTTGDLVNVLAFPAMNLCAVRPTQLGVNSGGMVVLSHATLQDFGANPGTDPYVHSAYVQHYEMLGHKYVVADVAALGQKDEAGFANCFLDGGFYGGCRNVSFPSNSGVYFLSAGAVQDNVTTGIGCCFSGVNLMNDIILTSPSNRGLTFAGYNVAGSVCVDTAQLTLQTGATFDISTAGQPPRFGPGPLLWGPLSNLDAGFGHVPYSGSAVATFVLAGGLRIEGGTVACSITIANPAVINSNVPLSPANLDAAAGATGFGGRAFQPGSGSFSNATI